MASKKVEHPGVGGKIITNLTKSYWMEIETIMNYISNSVNLDGVRAEEIKKSLAVDITEEMTHAQRLAKRIKEVGGTVPGSLEFKASQNYTLLFALCLAFFLRILYKNCLY